MAPRLTPSLSKYLSLPALILALAPPCNAQAPSTLQRRFSSWDRRGTALERNRHSSLYLSRSPNTMSKPLSGAIQTSNYAPQRSDMALVPATIPTKVRVGERDEKAGEARK
eukprot:1373121-Amorphochlora_amoeboformis.AAC.1